MNKIDKRKENFAYTETVTGFSVGRSDGELKPSLRSCLTVYLPDRDWRACVGGVGYTIKKGEALVVHPFELPISFSPAELTEISVGEDCLGEYAGRLRFENAVRDVFVVRTLREIADYAAAHPRTGTFGMMGYACFVLDALENVRCPGEKPRRSDAEIVAYIYDHADGEITLGGLAAVFGLSPVTVSKRLGAVTGTDLRAFVDDVRAQKAHRMILAAEVRRLQEIAQKCGFTCMTTFNRSYRRRYGCSPSDTRSRVANKTK